MKFEANKEFMENLSVTVVLTSEYVDEISWCEYCGTYTP